MATSHFTARAKDNRTLELPEEAQSLNIQPGDEVQIFINQYRHASSEVISCDVTQERYREITNQLFAEADTIERQPGIYSNLDKAKIAKMVSKKHRKIEDKSVSY